jgi:hypothetical protein
VFCVACVLLIGGISVVVFLFFLLFFLLLFLPPCCRVLFYDVCHFSRPQLGFRALFV